MALVRLAAEASQLLERLYAALAAEGLRIVMPLGPGEFDAVAGGGRVRAPYLAELMPGAGGAIVVGDGGPEFFARFAASTGKMASARHRLPAISGDPLDDYTRKVVEAALSSAWSPGASSFSFHCFYPFLNAVPALPFQRLGEAAGLPAPGPLGLQIHPTFGPWWAYRALIVVSFVVKNAPVLADAPCVGCPQPCVSACPAGAVMPSGLSVERCLTHRMRDPGCHGSCDARLGCPVGGAYRYPPEQLAFHMRASLRSAGDFPAPHLTET